jgi:hypothetical protein
MSLPGFDRIDTLQGFELRKHPGIEGGTLKGGSEEGTHFGKQRKELTANH